MNFEHELNDLVDRHMTDPDVDRTNEIISVLELKLMALREQQAGEQDEEDEN